MIIYEARQGTHDWKLARCGAITASMYSTVRDTLKTGKNKGGYKQAALDYAFRLAVERISGEPLDEGFETWAMRRGSELEPEARAAHAFMTDLNIEPVGFVSTEDRKFGASADGFIGDDGGSEYKCFVAPERLRPILLSGDFSEFNDQAQGGMWITGRKWWHCVLYCPALAAVGKDVSIHEVRRDDDYIEELEADLLAFDKLVCEYEDQLRHTDSGEIPGLKESVA